MTEDDQALIPALREPEKKKSEFAPVTPLSLVKDNGQRAKLKALENPINTWRQHGVKLLKVGNFSTLHSGGKLPGGTKVMCIVTCDEEKIAAFTKVSSAIDAQRVAAEKKENEEGETSG